MSTEPSEESLKSAAIIAMVSTTAMDSGLETGVKIITAISIFGMLATWLAAGSVVGGWFPTLVMLIGCLLGLLWMFRRRHGHALVAKYLISRFGQANFTRARPLLEQATAIIMETP